MVVLSGAHTIGGKGFGSPIVFDNTYFKVLLEKKPQTSSCKCMLILMPLSSDHILLTHKLFPSSLESQETTYPLKLIWSLSCVDYFAPLWSWHGSNGGAAHGLGTHWRWRVLKVSPELDLRSLTLHLFFMAKFAYLFSSKKKKFAYLCYLVRCELINLAYINQIRWVKG